MNNRKKYFVFAIFFICFVVVLIFVIFFLFGEKKSNIKNDRSNKKVKIELDKQEYLSITYTTSNSSTKTGRMMNFYTYDVNTNKLDKQAQIPFDSQYALGVVSLIDNKVYYTQRVGQNEKAVDHLFEFDLSKQESTMLEEINCAYNDIIPIKEKLLVTTVPVHAIGTALFNFETKKFSYLYEQSINEDGYKDFSFTTEPTPLNYNHHYNRFVNVSSLEKDFYDVKVRSGEKPLEYHIALVDDELKVKSEYIYSLQSLIDCNIAAVAQISQNTVLLLVKRDLSEDENSELECENEFYIINFKEQSCVKIDTPFPKMQYIDNFITIDDGRNYYISGENTEGESGLFLYNCSRNTTTSILLDDKKNDNHIVNFCLVEQ